MLPPAELANGTCVTEGAPMFLFFPPAGRSPNLERARSFCARCPVAEACLEHALEHEPAGAWGGKTAVERQQIRTSRRRTPDPCSEPSYARYMRHVRGGENACVPCRDAFYTYKNEWRAARRLEIA